MIELERFQFGVMHPDGRVEGPDELGRPVAGHIALTLAEVADELGCLCGATGHRLAYRILPDWRVRSS